MLNFVQRWTLLALALTLLNACMMGSSNAPSACPPIKEYSRAFQNRLAAEIEAAPEDAAFAEALKDYAVLRDQVRACR